jgi:hypothetical protein
MKLNVMTVSVLVLFVAGGAMAAQSYGDFIAPGTGFVSFKNVEESSVTDPTPLYGAPETLYTDTDPTDLVRSSILLFKPDNFASFAENGEADTTAGKLGMDIETSGEGWFLNQVIVSEFGDFGMTGAGNASANIFGMLALVDDETGNVLVEGLDVQPDPPYSLPSDTDGLFEATVTVDVSALELTKAEFVFNNVLQTTAAENTASFIQKKLIRTTVTTIIPEPATMALLGVGGVLALIRRRRS